MDALNTAILVRGVACIAAIIGAVYLFAMDMDGWGWLICVAILAVPSINCAGSRESSQ